VKVIDLKESINRITRIRENKGEKQVLTSAEIWKKIKDQPPQETIKSKLPLLDSITGGFEPGELVIISGPRKGGKTLLAQSLTTSFASQNITCLWFSYELTAKQLLERFPELPYFVLPNEMKVYSLEWVQDRIVEATLEYAARVVFIDHLHYLFDIGRSQNTSLEIGYIIRWLKKLAIDASLVIFLVCHMQKAKFETEPDDVAIRDSSFVAQESDTALILWRETKQENHACLKVGYHRRTGAMNRKISLIKVNGLLREREKEDRWTIPDR
jgi:replicative DNA helicase